MGDIAGNGGSRSRSFRILNALHPYAVESLVAIKNLPHYRHWPPVFIMYFRAMELKLNPRNVLANDHILPPNDHILPRIKI